MTFNRRRTVSYTFLKRSPDCKTVDEGCMSGHSKGGKALISPYQKFRFSLTTTRLVKFVAIFFPFLWTNKFKPEAHTDKTSLKVHVLNLIFASFFDFFSDIFYIFGGVCNQYRFSPQVQFHVFDGGDKVTIVLVRRIVFTGAISVFTRV